MPLLHGCPPPLAPGAASLPPRASSKSHAPEAVLLIRPGYFSSDSACSSPHEIWLSTSYREHNVPPPSFAAAFVLAQIVSTVEYLEERIATPGNSLFRRIDFGRVGLFGHSAGSGTAMQAAAEYGDRFKAVRVVGSSLSLAAAAAFLTRAGLLLFRCAPVLRRRVVCVLLLLRSDLLPLHAAQSSVILPGGRW